MKTLIILLLLKLTLFASPALDFSLHYEELNAEIDKMAPKLAPHEKVSLYYLVLSTHDKIATATLLGEAALNDYDETNQQTLKVLAALQSNEKLTKPEIQKLEALYNLMNKEGLHLIQEAQDNSENSIFVFALFSLASLVLGLILGFIFFRTPHARRDNIDIIDNSALLNLQEKYNNILDEVKSLERQKESWHVEVEDTNLHLKNEKNNLEREIQELKNKTTELQNSQEILISEFQERLQSLKQ